MKALMRILLALALLWAVAWFILAREIETRVTRWFAETSAAGMVAEKDGIGISGFAYRFDLTIDRPHFAQTGWDWQAPFAQIFAMAWKPWHLIAILPGGQTLTLPDQSLTIETPKIEASLRMAPEAALPPREARLEWPEVSVTSSQGWTLAMGHLLAAAQVTPDQAVKLWLQADDILLPEGSDIGGQGRNVTHLRLDARLPLAAPLTWERAAFSGFTLRSFEMQWGKLGVEGEGSLQADAMGRAEGQIDLRFSQWRALPDMAIELGLIPPGLRGALMGGLEPLAEGEELTLPLIAKDGALSLGPIPLGPAPYLQ